MQFQSKKAFGFDKMPRTLFCDLVYNVRMYIETVILNNFVLTFFAARLASIMLSKRSQLLRVVGVSALGTIAAVFYPFIYLPTIALVAIKLAVCAALCFLLFFKTYRAVASSLVFLGIIFLFGGTCYAAGFLIFGNTVAAEALFDRIPLFAVLIVAGIVYVSARVVFLAIRKRVNGMPFTRKCRLNLFGSDVNFSAFYDSGNSSFDERSGLPIVLAPIKSLLRHIPSCSVGEFMRSLTVCRKTTIKTAGGKTQVYLIKPKEFMLYTECGKHKIIEVMLGLFAGEEIKDYDLILNNCVR